MSPKKITDADKLEIVNLYRQSRETTASLADRYGVSNSTISRLLKITIPDDEYEVLIQQKRGSKVGSEDEDSISTVEIVTNLVDEDRVASTLVLRDDLETIANPTEDFNANPRRVRRRSSAPIGDTNEPIAIEIVPQLKRDLDQPAARLEPALPELVNQYDEPKVIRVPLPTRATAPVPVSRTPVLRDLRSLSTEDDFAPLVSPVADEDLLEDEIDEDPEDVSILAAMFGEEISDLGDDDDDFDDEDDEGDEDSTTVDRQLDGKQLLSSNLQIQVTPLSQATLPRTCYIVIDKFAELIVRPLKDFAELGQIPEGEVQQRTLPIFDNHRVAKRFSNQRTQRVIKVPDSKVFHKTSHHLRSKGIARLLVDGNIYSLN